LGNLATFHSLLGDRALIGRWLNAMAPPKVALAKMLHGASQKYFIIHCEHRIFLARPSGFPANNTQPEGLVLVAIEPYMSVANYIPEDQISPE
jgi:hypothetical protein